MEKAKEVLNKAVEKDKVCINDCSILIEIGMYNNERILYALCQKSDIQLPCP